jgi:hypothetical protein
MRQNILDGNCFIRNSSGGQRPSLNVRAGKNTQARSINARGEIVGVYSDPGGTLHGFLARAREDNSHEH